MIGMLWFDNDPKTAMEAKIGQAADYYREKYGKRPNVCLVNPKMVNGQPPSVNGVRVSTSKSILVNHYFLGVE